MFGKVNLEDKLAKLPVDERLRLTTIGRESTKFKVNTLLCEGSYNHPKSREVFDLLGPCDHVPYYFVAKNPDEFEYMKRNDIGLTQVQLVVQEQGIYLRELSAFHSENNIDIRNEEAIFFSDGHFYRLNSRREEPSEKYEFGAGGYQSTGGQKWRSYIGSPSLAWIAAVERMTSYFTGLQIYPPGIEEQVEETFGISLVGGGRKIIFGSERCKDTLLTTFDKLGLKPVTLN